MEDYELIFFAVIGVLFFVLSVVVYFYNRRHKKNITVVESDIYEVEHEKDEIAFKKNKVFDWDITSKNKNTEINAFIGYEVWSSAKAAKKRIEELNKSFMNEGYIYLYMLEILLLIEDYGEEIVLKESGEYCVSKYAIRTFLNELVYDIETKSKVEDLKDEYLRSCNGFEINAEDILNIMRNSKTFGLDGIDDRMHFFKIIDKKKNQNDFADIESEDNSLVKLEIVNDVNYLKNEIEIKEKYKQAEEEKENKEKIKTILAETKKEVKITKSEDGSVLLKYSNGLEIEKISAWEVSGVKNTQAELKQNNVIKEFIVPDNKDEIFNTKNEQKKQQEKKIKNSKHFIEPSLNLKNKEIKNEEGDLKEVVGFLGEVKSLSEFEKKVNNLSTRELKQLIESLIDYENSIFKNSAVPGIESYSHVMRSKNKIYITYEYVIYYLALLASNTSEFLEKEIIRNMATMAINFPAVHVEIFLKNFKTKIGENAFFESANKNYFNKLFRYENCLIKSNLLIVEARLTENLSLDNLPEIEIINEIELPIEEKKKLKKEAHNIRFNIFEVA